MVETNAVAVVTGAGRSEGIGFEIARQLGLRGLTVILTARTVDDARARAADLAALGLTVVGYGLDITAQASLETVSAAIRERFGKLDILINNAAGVTPYGEQATTADLAMASAVMETTLFGTWRATQTFLPLLRKSAHPRIVNVSSGAGSHGDPVFGLTTANGMGTSYAVAKAALNALTVKLANEVRADGVLVNAVCPGFTATFPGGKDMGARPVADGAASVVWAALLADDGPTGGLFRDGQPLPW